MKTRILVVLLVLPLLSGCDAIRQIISSISDGASCTAGSQCLGGTCFTHSQGFPEGYCTTLDCDTQGCSNIFGSECLVLNQVRSQAACYSLCAQSEDCREGYTCVDGDGTRICLPVELASGLPGAGETGTSCSRDSDCLGGTCLQNLTGGYCTLADCSLDADCDEFGDGRCLPQGDDISGVTACFDGCQRDSECRFGYGCVDSDARGGVCTVLDDSSPVRNPNGLDDGEPCLVDINCKGGTCLRDEEGYPDGYCTTLSCTRLGCNSEDALCISFEPDSACFAACADDTQCRDGYICLGEGYCGPPINTVVPTDPGGSLDIVCESESIGGGRRFNFQIEGSTESFAVVPFSNEAIVRPTTLRLPDGTVGADFNSSYAFMDVNWQILQNISPVFFPAAPQFANITQQGGGMYSLDVETSDREPCMYVLEKALEGSSLAVNIYLVGVPGLNASSARNDTDLNQVLSAFERIYADAGITITETRFFELSSSDTERFRIIRDFTEIYELIARSTAPGDTLEEALSVNIFLIQDFAIPQAPGVLGISAGIPGVPGLHGTQGSGLVFTSASLGSSNASLGQTMAHEVGHFNGLRHTTEHGGGGDPLDDTAQCRDPNNGASCPDSGNFMFPFSVGGLDQTTVSDDQGQVLRWSPLVR